MTRYLFALLLAALVVRPAPADIAVIPPEVMEQVQHDHQDVLDLTNITTELAEALQAEQNTAGEQRDMIEQLTGEVTAEQNELTWMEQRITDLENDKTGIRMDGEPK